MEIRKLRPADLPVVRNLVAEAFDGVSIDQGMERKFGLINGHDWKWRKARHVDEDVLRDPEGAFVVTDNGRVVGCITTWEDREAGIGHIPNLAFAPEYRGRGLGRKLIELALKRFRDSGLTHARIETLVQNEVGNHLYRSLGFEEVARQVHFVMELDEGAESTPASPSSSESRTGNGTEAV